MAAARAPWLSPSGILSDRSNHRSWVEANSLYLEPQELAGLLEADASSVIILDVRDDDAEGGHIASALHFPDTTFRERLDEVVALVRSKDPKFVVLHCMESIMRGPRCAKRLFDAFGAGSALAGRIRVLKGGANTWIRKHFADARLVEDFDVEFWWGALPAGGSGGEAGGSKGGSGAGGGKGGSGAGGSGGGGGASLCPPS